MAKNLPRNPSLEQLSKQAKDLLKAHRKGDSSICERLKTLHRFSGSTDKEILSAKLTLIDAQFVLAMEYGFKTWNEMKTFVRSSKIRGPFTEIDDLNSMSDRGIRWLIQEAGPTQMEVVLGLSYMSSPLFERFWRKLSQPERERIQEDWKWLAGRAYWERVKGCLETLIRMANELAERHKDEIYAEGDEWKENWEREIVEWLKDKPAKSREAAELIPIFVTLVRAARQNGLSGLKVISEEFFDDEFIWRGLKLASDGRDVKNAMKDLEEMKRKMLSNYERRLALVLTGVENLILGNEPDVMDRNCRAVLG